jgi:hypothetical protein
MPLLRSPRLRRRERPADSASPRQIRDRVLPEVYRATERRKERNTAGCLTGPPRPVESSCRRGELTSAVKQSSNASRQPVGCSVLDLVAMLPGNDRVRARKLDRQFVTAMSAYSAGRGVPGRAAAPGQCRANTTAAHIAVLDQALAQIPDEHRHGGPLLVRAERGRLHEGVPTRTRIIVRRERPHWPWGAPPRPPRSTAAKPRPQPADSRSPMNSRGWLYCPDPGLAPVGCGRSWSPQRQPWSRRPGARCSGGSALPRLAIITGRVIRRLERTPAPRRVAGTIRRAGRSHWPGGPTPIPGRRPASVRRDRLSPRTAQRRWRAGR